MNIEVIREHVTDNGVFGSLFINDIRVGISLENLAAMIPIGEYKAEIYDSPEFKTKLVRLLNVPERDGIEIHPGNYPTQSRGCILIGFIADIKNDQVLVSRACFKHFMDIVLTLKDGEELTVSIQSLAEGELLNA